MHLGGNRRWVPPIENWRPKNISGMIALKLKKKVLPKIIRHDQTGVMDSNRLC